MQATPPAEVTTLLLAWRQGDAGAFNKVAGLVYQELRRLARCHLRGERPDHTLQTTALAHEAYLRLIDVRRVQWQDRAHFLAMASRMMRRVLVDAARTRHAAKRDGGLRVTMDLALALPGRDDVDVDLVALDEALDALAELDARKSQVVEMRFFGGLTLAETAAVLEVSEDTVSRDWNFVKTWLRRRLVHHGRRHERRVAAAGRGSLSRPAVTRLREVVDGAGSGGEQGPDQAPGPCSRHGQRITTVMVLLCRSMRIESPASAVASPL